MMRDFHHATKSYRDGVFAFLLIDSLIVWRHDFGALVGLVVILRDCGVHPW